MTGAEAIVKIMDKVNELTTTMNALKESIHFIEANIKILNNRAGGLMQQQQEQKKIALPITASVPTIAEVPKSTAIEETPIDKPGAMVYKKVFGKLINNAKEPIENVIIRVYDKNNEVCAAAETDPIGYWEVMLSPGRYVAEYTKSGFKTVNKTFEVLRNSKEIEVK